MDQRRISEKTHLENIVFILLGGRHNGESALMASDTLFDGSLEHSGGWRECVYRFQT